MMRMMRVKRIKRRMLLLLLLKLIMPAFLVRLVVRLAHLMLSKQPVVPCSQVHVIVMH